MRALANPCAIRDDRRRMKPWAHSVEADRKARSLEQTPNRGYRAERRECRQGRSRSSAIPSSTRTAESARRLQQRKVPRFARNVTAPLRHARFRLRREISSSGGLPNRHPNFCANFSKFHGEGSSILCGAVWSLAHAKEEVQPALRAYSLKSGAAKPRQQQRPAFGARCPRLRERSLQRARTRNKNMVRGRVQVWRCDLQPVIQQRQQVVRHNAFQCFTVVVTQLHPQSVQLWACSETPLRSGSNSSENSRTK